MQITAVKINRLMIIGWLMLNFLSFGLVYAQIRTRVILIGGGNQIARKNVSETLSLILQEANKLQEGKGNLDNVRPYCTEAGFKAFKELVEKTGLFSTYTEYRTRLLETATDQYEVRGLKVKVNLGETAGDPIQELVFSITPRLYIDNVQFAIEMNHYNRILEKGLPVEDLAKRQQILGFLEEFRTAHGRKDLNYLERAYSDDALIIVGRVLQKKEGEDDFMSRSTLGDSVIQFIKLSKREYVDRLRKVFAANSFVRVIFDNATVTRHSKYPDIYGIQVKQRWNSSNYSDEGYLFIMMDFKNPQTPLIHVRAWQPQPFKDGSVIGLGDFEVME